MAVANVPDDTQCGGYDYKFAEKVPEKHICWAICTKVLRDPHLTACCGQHFCETCLQHWFRKQGREVCPHCREENFNHFLNKPVKREIDGLKLYCTNYKAGCKWIGELSTLKTHLESERGCGYVEVDCPNKCMKRMKRKDLAVHLTQHPQCKYECQYCRTKDTYHMNTLRHYNKCPNYPLDCPNKCGTKGIKRAEMKGHQSTCQLEPVRCPFQEAGCQAELVRKDVDHHIASSNQQHLLQVMSAFQTLKKQSMREMEELHDLKTELHLIKRGVSNTVDHLLQSCDKPQAAPLQSIKALLSGRLLRRVGDHITVMIPDTHQYIRYGDTWHSPPFYYKDGYKLRLDVSLYAVLVQGLRYLNTVCSLHLLRGELDGEIEWPINYSNTVEIVFQLKYNNEVTFFFDIDPVCKLSPMQRGFETVEIGSENITGPYTLMQSLPINITLY